MEKPVKILVNNNSSNIEIPMGCTLEEAYKLSGLELKYGPVSARVNNKIEGMHYRIYNRKEVEFLDITTSSGIRAYTRTLFFILCKAAHELFDEAWRCVLQSGYRHSRQQRILRRPTIGTPSNPRRCQLFASEDAGDYRCCHSHPPS